jgi:hypothetical protein
MKKCVLFAAVKLFVAGAVSLGCGVGRAQNLPARSPEDMAARPESYVGRAIDWEKGFCFADQDVFVCVGADQPFEVVAKRLASPSVLEDLKSNCGGLDAAERNPSPECAHRFRFVTGTFERFTGDYVLRGQLKSGARMVRFRADALEVFKK